jgi:flagellar protein FlaG
MRIEKGVSNNYDAAVSTTKEAPAVKELEDSTVNNEKRTDVSSDSVVNDDMLDNAVKQANKNLNQYNKIIERSVHEKTHTIIYVLKDSLTGEVIREFPPRKIQDMIAKMWEIAGILVDERR